MGRFQPSVEKKIRRKKSLVLTYILNWYSTSTFNTNLISLKLITLQVDRKEVYVKARKWFGQNWPFWDNTGSEMCRRSFCIKNMPNFLWELYCNYTCQVLRRMSNAYLNNCLLFCKVRYLKKIHVVVFKNHKLTMSGIESYSFMMIPIPLKKYWMI